MTDDLWWTCEFYNKDTLPVELDIKLRVNRRALTLPDSYGQIWLIDSYWFDTFYQVLETLKTLLTPAAEAIQVSDWAKLAAGLGNKTYTATDVHQLFYPKDSSDGNDLAAPTSR
ncbi:hypothetical protein NCS52_01509700 [Fusarium sp. LHS14.1]|nr:hypothetical protein NCS52_01509700 [Fusarium sp. LHS14.1]